MGHRADCGTEGGKPAGGISARPKGDGEGPGSSFLQLPRTPGNGRSRDFRFGGFHACA